MMTLFPALLIVIVVLTISLASAAWKYEKMKYRKTGLEAAVHKIPLSIKGKTVFINCSDILYIASHGKKCVIHCIDKYYEFPGVLGKLESMFAESDIVRVHKCYMINRKIITSLSYHKGGYYSLILEDDDESIIPVGRRYLAMLKKNLQIQKSSKAS